MSATSKDPVIGQSLKLQEVFGVTPGVKSHSYINRGGLDEELRFAAESQRLIIIHGDSKQGKTWLRQSVLPAEACITVQCMVGGSPASILTQALGILGIKAELKQSSASDLQGSFDLSTSGDLGIKLLAKIGLKSKVGGKAGHQTTREFEPIGQTTADLAWVAKILQASEKRLVIEDFHYLDEQNRKQFAFLLKALGDYEVHPVIIGVWPQNHLLTYYNGDLSERVEDIHLTWESEELEEVLRQGSTALNVTISPPLRKALVADAYGNVGTLQSLAQALCKSEGIYERRPADKPGYLGLGDTLGQARLKIADGMRSRFQGFADSYLAGLQQLPDPDRTVLQAAIEIVCAHDDEALLRGVPMSQLRDALNEEITHAELLQCLGGIERFQADLEISPLVMTFDKHAQSICLLDRRFLFYRKYAKPQWPWVEDRRFAV